MSPAVTELVSRSPGVREWRYRCNVSIEAHEELKVAPKLTDIQHIVVVMLENRSFDHMLGYLSMTPWLRTNIEGLRDDPSWMEQKASVYRGKKFPPWYCDDPFNRLLFDPPHERDPISIQLGNKRGSEYSMDGFVTNYANYASSHGIELDDHPSVMSYFKSKEVPINHFLAENFAICDHWFSSLPAGDATKSFTGDEWLVSYRC